MDLQVNTGSQIRVHILPENWHHELCRLFLCRTSLHRQPPSTQQAPDGPVSTERPTRCSSTDDLPPGFGSHADSSAAALTADRNASARADGEVSSNDVSIRPARLPDTCKASGKENAPQQANGQQQKGGDPQKGGSEQRAAEGGQLPAAAGAGSEQDMAQYWALAPGVRLRLLRDLCHAALDHYIIRWAAGLTHAALDHYIIRWAADVTNAALDHYIIRWAASLTITAIDHYIIRWAAGLTNAALDHHSIRLMYSSLLHLVGSKPKPGPAQVRDLPGCVLAGLKVSQLQVPLALGCSC